MRNPLPCPHRRNLTPIHTRHCCEKLYMCVPRSSVSITLMHTAIGIKNDVDNGIMTGPLPRLILLHISSLPQKTQSLAQLHVARQIPVCIISGCLNSKTMSQWIDHLFLNISLHCFVPYSHLNDPCYNWPAPPDES